MSSLLTVDGLVVLQHRTANPATVKMQDGTLYSWSPQHNVSIALVSPQHVGELLNLMAKICCGKTGHKFFPATQVNYNLWRFGDRHGQNS